MENTSKYYYDKKGYLIKTEHFEQGLSSLHIDSYDSYCYDISKQTVRVENYRRLRDSNEFGVLDWTKYFFNREY